MAHTSLSIMVPTLDKLMNTKPKIRVLQAIRQGLIGGGETHVLGLVHHIDRSRFEPIVLSFTEGPMIDRLKELKIKCYVIPSTKAFDIIKWGKVRSLLQQEDIDIVHVHGTRAASNLFWASRSCQIPILYTVHGWSFHNNQSMPVRKLRILSEQYLTNQMDLNISVSASNMQSGRKHIRGFDAVVVNNGIDLKTFNPTNKYTDIREELRIPKNSLLITFIARMTVQKGPLTLLHAFKKVTQKFNDVYLLMVGEGELRARAERLALELEIRDRVVFENFRQDIPSILNACDIYCLPSLWEGLPIGLLEAMAMRSTVVATRVDGSEEIIDNNENGLLVMPGSVNELSGALISLCMNSGKRAKFQASAREMIVNNFDVNAMTTKLENIYSKLIIPK